MEHTANRSVLFKIKHEDDLRRWTSNESALSFAAVLDRSTQLFSIPHEDIHLKYLDDEGDWVTLACDDDLQEAISISPSQDTNKILLRIDVSVKPSQSAPPPSRVAELEEAVHRLECEAKKHAEMLSKEGNKAAQLAVEFLHRDALPKVRDALPKVMQGLAQAVEVLTPRDCDNSAAHEAIATLHAMVEQALPDPAEETTVHDGIWCDVCNMRPILGVRYTKQLDHDTFDVCSACFHNLDEEKANLTAVSQPKLTVKQEVNAELEARHGWGGDVISMVQNSRLAAVIEAAQSKIPSDAFEHLVATIEPVFAVPQKYLDRVMHKVEPMVVAIMQDPALLHSLPEHIQNILADPASVEYPQESYPILFNIAGTYECRMYDETEHKNAWHYVTIEMTDDHRAFLWRNEGGVQWSLHPTQDAHVFRVGEDCPYFEDGHHQLIVEVDVDGGIQQVVGPHDETYVSAEFPLHDNIWCDACTTHPIRGVRYTKQLEHDTYDVCGACYNQLEEEHKAELTAIYKPQIIQVTAPQAAVDEAPEEAVEEAREEHIVEVGPIWGQEHAQRVAAEYLEAHDGHSWSGHWWTTVPKEMSVLHIIVPVGGTVEQAWRPAVIEADPDAVIEADSEAPPVIEYAPACTVQDALDQMGMANTDLSASMLAGIEQMVEGNVQAAEETAAAEAATAKHAAAEAAAAEAAAQAIAAEQAAAAERAAAEAAAEAEKAAADEKARAEADALIQQLTGMGFSHQAAEKAIVASEGNVEAAINILIAFPEEEEVSNGDVSDNSAVWNQEWDSLLDELSEMGFENDEINRSVLAEANGDVKDAVKQLVSLERNSRQ